MPEKDSLHDQILTFRHGIHPEEYKHLSNKNPIERMPFVQQYILHLSQHIGAASIPIVKKGDYVKRGQKIANPGGFVSVALHSPVDGWVSDIGLYDHPTGKASPAIRIKADSFSAQILNRSEPHSLENMDPKAFIDSLQDAGMVGLGGAAFPSHVKFVIPKEKKCKYLMLNGCECEPFLTCDHRVMLEYADELLDGIQIVQCFLKAERVIIAIENNKFDAIQLLQKKILKDQLNIELAPLRVKYPQGAEKMMISAILKKEVPSGKLPLDLGAMVSNVATIVAISKYFRESQSLFERVITVTGTAIKRPANVLVPIGTSMREVVDFCGGITKKASRILLGGPMMGFVQKNLNVPVLKGTSGILVLTDKELGDYSTYSCIRCGRCLEACPIFLNPARLGLFARKGLWEDMKEHNVLDCFECASCSYVCPSGIPLVQSFRVGKSIIREKMARERMN